MQFVVIQTERDRGRQVKNDRTSGLIASLNSLEADKIRLNASLVKLERDLKTHKVF